MSPDAQRIAIAEACGWTDIASGANAQNPHPYGKPPAGVSVGINGVNELPAYLTDLNAMHEAEKVLTLESGQFRAYENNLRQALVVSGRKVCSVHEEHKFLHATAAQRAEAFLKTLNLWTT